MSLYKISVWNLCTSSLEELSWLDLCKRPRGKISVQISRRGLLARPPGQDLYKRSLGKISLWDLCTSFLEKLSWQDLCKRPLGKICATGSLCNVSVQGLHKRSPGKISVQDHYKRSLGKISVTGLSAGSQRSLCNVSVQDLCMKPQYNWAFEQK